MPGYQFTPGPLSAADAQALTDLARAADGQAGLDVAPPLCIARQGYDGQAVVYLDPSALDPYLWAELTGSASTAGSGSGSGSGVGSGVGSGGVDADRRVYSWVERVETAAGVWADGPRSGVLNAYAVESRGGFAGVVAAGTAVLLRESATQPGAYEFLPAGAAGSGSGSGSGGGEVLIGSVQADTFCVGGVIQVWKSYLYQAAAGTVRVGAAFFAHTAGCCACGSGSGSGSGSAPASGGGSAPAQGGFVSCCNRTLNATLYLSLSNGGTVTLAWNGTAWVGSASLAGCVVDFVFDTNCGLSYSTGGGVAIGANCRPPCTVTCTVPFSKGSFDIQSGLVGGTCTFGNITGVVSE